MGRDTVDLLQMVLDAVIINWDDASIITFAVNRLEWGILITASDEETPLFTVQNVIEWIERNAL